MYRYMSDVLQMSGLYLKDEVSKKRLFFPSSDESGVHTLTATSEASKSHAADEMPSERMLPQSVYTTAG